jgi:(1->4)-alpha-D-glucan 1-alpha-D-glucosylmutase
MSVDEFHQQCRARWEKWPAGLSATSTHDTKRSEDVRARINVLSEIPRAWREAVARWHRWNRRHLTEVDGVAAPDRSDAYLLYQTLVGAWPSIPPRRDEAAAFTARIQQYMLKAAKEAKLNTSWINPNEAYDEALKSFVARVLAPEPDNRFMTDFLAFHLPIARLGMVNSLAQTLLKITAPGVPDFYQGTDVWDFSLVDPDNRRPVDFATRATLLADLQKRIAKGTLAPLARELAARWEDGRIKLYTIHRALDWRRQVPDLFHAGDYVLLRTGGSAGDHVVAFARWGPTGAALTVVPRLIAPLTDTGARLPLGPEAWSDTLAFLPSVLPDGPYLNLFTGAEIGTVETEGGRAFAVEEVLREFPVALLCWKPAAERGA